MDLRNCKRCDRLFQYQGSDLCMACRRDVEDEFMIVKDYLRENPGKTVPDVVEATGVSLERIREFLREERLEMDGEAGYILECEGCGTKIPSGRFCQKCINNLTSELSAAAKPKTNSLEKTKPDGNKFRIIDRYNK